MSSVNERIEKLTEELKAAVEKHNEALQIVNTEKENALQYASSVSEVDDIHQGWIEALEYCVREIELLEAK